MSNLQAIGANGEIIFLRATGEGENDDPFVLRYAVEQIGTWTFNLPTDAATSTNQETIIGHLDGLESLLAGTLTVAPANNAVFYSSLPKVASATILSLTTNATGTTYTAFSSQDCTALDLVNNTGTTLEYRRGGAGVALQIPDKSARLILGITNANQIDVRRTDTSNTQVTLQVEAFVL